MRLTRSHRVVHVRDYDHWIGFVCQFVDRDCGFHVDVEAAPFGSPSFLVEDFATATGTPDEVRVMREVVTRLWDRFLAEVEPTEPPPAAADLRRWAGVPSGNAHVTDGAMGFWATFPAGTSAEAVLEAYMATADYSDASAPFVVEATIEGRVATCKVGPGGEVLS